MPEASKFKQENSFEDRKKETVKIMKKYDDRIPIIIERSARTDLPDVEKNKYLVPDTLTVGQFIFTALRTRLKIDREKALFVFINDQIPPTSASLKDVYDEHKDEDGFLYITYAGENTFG
jgi:GABA(A) receptor-associated protein